jgi:hypothetical protein
MGYLCVCELLIDLDVWRGRSEASNDNTRTLVS